MGAGYVSTVNSFSSTDAHAKLGSLVSSVANSGISSQRREQIEAWEQTIQIVNRLADSLKLRSSIAGQWSIILEYEIPRRARRPDLIILARDLIFVVEFKVGAEQFHSADRWQTRDYALNLQDFHRESHNRAIVPLLIATNASSARPPDSATNGAKISPVQCLDLSSMVDRILELHAAMSDPTTPSIDPQIWIDSPYRPTPTIVEAAQSLFSSNRVADISHRFATNLTDTTQSLVRAISDSRTRGLRTICFVTGIPGAGKTLTGLNAAHDPTLQVGGDAIVTFLSGNGPLISVIHESLVRDSMRRGMSREEAEHRVSAFIHDVHRFMKLHGIEKPNEPPPEHVVIFDEAQRAWDATQMKRKKKPEKSEAEFIFEIMERAPNWATVIAIVGGGQEINEGEAGLEEWGRALRGRPVHWNVMASPEVLELATLETRLPSLA